MTDSEKVIILRAALENIVGGLRTGLTNGQDPLEWVREVAVYNLNRIKD